MKRIGLIIFITLLIGLIFNISLISTFGENVNQTTLNLGLLVGNIAILGFTVGVMINENAYISHIVILSVMYIFILIQIVSSLFFSQNLKDKEVVEVVGVVKEVNTVGINNRDTYQLKVEIENLNANNLILNKNLLITSFENIELEIGDEILANVKINNKNNRYALSKGAESSANFVEYKKIGSKFLIAKYAKECQSVIQNLINNCLDEPYSNIVGTFLIGSELEDEQNKQALIVSGIYHIMAISGLHIGILTSLLLYILNLVFYRRTALKVTIVSLITYGFITGFSASTIRAVLMATIALSAKIFCTSEDKLNTVGVAGSIILFFAPLSVYNLGFIYSFTIVIGLIISVPTVKFAIKTLTGLSYNKDYMLVDYFATIITAQLYFIPISFYFYDKLYIYALIVNAITIFLVPTLFVCSILMLMFYGTFISSLFGVVVKFLCDYILLCANYFYNLPKSEIYLGKPSLIMVIIFYAVLLGVSYYATKNIYEVNNGHFSETKIFEE